MPEVCARVTRRLLPGLGLVAFALCVGCDRRAPVKGALGSASIDELLTRYKAAHQHRDMEALRALVVWAPLANEGKEGPIRQIFDFPLKDVKFEAGPPPDPRIGGEVIYYIPNGNKDDRVIGFTYGKMLLVGTDGTTLDPSYVVLKNNGRYWLNVLGRVVQDAAEALREHRKPKYVPAPMQRVPDASKGERARRFK
jgi:hypothetical protein